MQYGTKTKKVEKGEPKSKNGYAQKYRQESGESVLKKKRKATVMGRICINRK